eukprot:2973689-Rhodomonas_salina.1
MEIGRHCKHHRVYTVLDLGDYDVILGRPFQTRNYSGARIDPNECQVPTLLEIGQLTDVLRLSDLERST